jgi:hypothetical protein
MVKSLAKSTKMRKTWYFIDHKKHTYVQYESWNKKSNMSSFSLSWECVHHLLFWACPQMPTKPSCFEVAIKFYQIDKFTTTESANNDRLYLCRILATWWEKAGSYSDLPWKIVCWVLLRTLSQWLSSVSGKSFPPKCSFREKASKISFKVSRSCWVESIWAEVGRSCRGPASTSTLTLNVVWTASSVKGRAHVSSVHVLTSLKLCGFFFFFLIYNCWCVVV